MKKIKQINILGKEFKIIWKAPKNKENSGECDLDNKTITIDPNINDSEMKETLIHEIYHVFLDYYDLENSEILATALTKFYFDLRERI